MVTIRLIAHYNTCFHRSHKTIRAKLFPHSAQCIILKSLVMKRFSKLMILAIAISSGMMSCSTNAVEDEPTPINPESETRTLNIRVVSNDFTRADESGNEINTLYLAFYKGDDTTPLYIKEATMGQNNTYSVEIPTNMAKMLDKVIAFANITDKDIISGALTGSTVGKVQNDDGSLIMSSAVYFESNASSNSTPIYSSSLPYNETAGNETIDIHLDRVASKITVNGDNLSITNPTVENSQNLSMEIIGWGLNFTDNKSYLMKHLPEPDGYSTTLANLQRNMQTDFAYSPSEWNKSDFYTISWANSINYSNFSEDNLDKIMLSQAKNALGSSLYAHESTRSITDVEEIKLKPSTVPSIVLVGQYTKANTPTGTTLYRLRSNGKDYLYTAEEYFKYLYDSQDFLYVKENETPIKATVAKLQELLTLSNPLESVAGIKIPDFYVCPQLKNDQSSIFCDKMGNDYLVSDLNELLYAYAGLLEKYWNGQCVFIEAIKHYQNNGYDIYGIVRNHTYTLDIRKIKGFGRGIASDDSIITDEELSDFPKSYQISIETTEEIVNTWNDQEEQIVEIEN